LRIVCNEYDKDRLVRDFINELSEKNKFGKLPRGKSKAVREFYLVNLPEVLEKGYRQQKVLGILDKDMKVRCNIYTNSSIMFATGLSRIVIGDYGAYFEIPQDKMMIDVLRGAPGQEFRYLDEKYKDKVKYNHLTCIEDTSIKIYYQKKTVNYADYKPGFFYVSPYECILEK
jgi:hypothetical protein